MNAAYEALMRELEEVDDLIRNEHDTSKRQPLIVERDRLVDVTWQMATEHDAAVRRAKDAEVADLRRRVEELEAR